MADDGSSVGSPSPEDAAFFAVFPNGLPASGRPATATSTIVRTFQLTPEHLARLAEGIAAGPHGVDPRNELKRLKRRHHRLAMLLAGGTEPSRAAMLCGYNPSFVHTLTRDPMFAELLELYAEGVTAEFRETIAEMREFTDDVIEELRHRLETNPEQFTVAQLNDLVKTFADRSGNGPTSTSNVNTRVAVVDGATLERIKAGLASRTGNGPERQVQRLSEDDQRAIEGVYRVAAPELPALETPTDDGAEAWVDVRASHDPPAPDELFAGGDHPTRMDRV